MDDVVVVVGAHPLETDARLVDCPDWEQGPGASLRCGLAALGEDVEAAVVVLADGPDLAPAAVDRVLAVWRQGAAFRTREPAPLSPSSFLATILALQETSILPMKSPAG